MNSLIGYLTENCCQGNSCLAATICIPPDECSTGSYNNIES